MTWSTPPTFLAGAVATAANLQALSDNLSAIGDPWIPYTPTWTAQTTNPSLGSGTITGAYAKAGSLVHWRMEILFAADTTAGSGTWYFTLPAPVFATYYPLGHLMVRASAGGHQGGMVYGRASGDVAGHMFATDTALDDATRTWGAGDRVNILGVYEAA